MSAKPRKSDLGKSFGRSNRAVDAPRNTLGQTFLHLAVKKGDTEAVIKLLSFRNADPNVKDKQGRTPLFEAIATRNLVMVALLLEYGAAADVTDKQNRTPVQCAINEGCDAEFLKNLDVLGAFSLMPGADGTSALHTAAAHNREDLVSYLIKRGIPVDAKDDAGRTPLHAAAESRAHDALRHLLKSGANPVERTNGIETPLHIAAALGDETAVDILLDYPAVRTALNEYQTYSDGFTPLLAAISRDHRGVIQKLLDCGANVNQTDNSGRHSLFLAVESGHISLAKMLIEQGADVTKPIVSPSGKTSLIHAINAKTPDYYAMLEMLYGAGADVNAAGHYNLTALHHAISEQDKKKIIALLDYGADVNAADTGGRRALDMVIENIPYAYYNRPQGKDDYNGIEVLKELIARGADVNLPPDTPRAWPPLHSATRHAMKDVVELLLKHKADVNAVENLTGHKGTPLLMSLEWGQAEVTKLLLKNGADPLKKDGLQRGALHMSSSSGGKETTEMLLKIPGVEKTINDTDSYGMTPLHYACRNGRGEIAALLLKNGADYATADTYGQTAVHYIVQSGNADLLSVIEKSSKSSDFVNIRNLKNGETPLHLAVRFWYDHILLKLLSLGADVTIGDETGLTPVHLAFIVNNPLNYKHIAEHLAKKKIPLDQIRDKKGMTPLHFVSMHGAAQQTLPFLLDKGSDINAVTAAGETPLHLAVKTGLAENVKMLVARGADLSAKNAEGQTALDIAKKLENGENIIELLTPAKDAKKPKTGPVRGIRRTPPKP